MRSESFFIVAALTLSASSASATERLAGSLPALPHGCLTCHITAPGEERNNFGKDANYSVVDDVLRWDLLYNVDSDGDGQTNGMELGDPCGEWTGPGTPPPRTTDLSGPGHPDETSANPLIGCSPGNTPPAEPSPRPEPPTWGGPVPDGDPEPEGCLGEAPASRQTAAPTSLTWLSVGLLAALFVRRRRRR